MLIVIATIDVLPGHEDAFIHSARECIAETRDEAGCVVYDLHRSVTEPTHFTFVERWETHTDIDAHMRSAHLQTFLAAAKEHLADAPVVEVVTPEAISRLM